ncbi:pathogenesis-related protein [Exophiala dermatitidis]
MKASICAVAAACAGLAAATPFDKRALVTTYEWVTLTVTVTGSEPAETAGAFFQSNAGSLVQSDTPASSVQAAVSAEATVTSWGSGSWGTGSHRSGWGSGSGSGSGSGWWGAWRWGNSGSDGSGTAVATTWDSQTAIATITQTQTPAVSTIQPTTTSVVIPTYATPSSSSSASAVVSTPSASASATASSISTPSSSTSSALSVSTSVSSDYQQGILDSHNIHRQNASVANLVWSDNMASIAAQIAASCVYAHDTSTGGGGYGQNIGAGAPPSDIPAMITNEMYNGEINYYPAYGVEPDMSNFEKWGHYSQIVWKSTTSVGCATQYCPNGLANVGSGVSPYFTVCNYSPAGNFGGQYAANVLKPKGLPTVTL